MLARVAARRGAEAGFPAIPAVPMRSDFRHFWLTICDQWLVSDLVGANNSGFNSGKTARYQRRNSGITATKKQHISAHDAISLYDKSNIFPPITT
jgi:hypothetical protein